MKASLFISALLAALSNLSAGVISPDGSAYTVISAPVFNSSYEAENLFDQNLAEGDNATSGNDSNSAWAASFSADRKAVLVFELDDIYDFDELFYAQRQFNNNSAGDKMKSVEIWVSSSDDLTAARPSRAPDVVVNPLTRTQGTQFLRYDLGTAIRGRYVRMEFDKVSATDYPGGAELRMGGVLADTTNPSNIISPDGSLYTAFGVSTYANANYRESNLFDQLLEIGDDPGTGNDSGRSWAAQNTDQSPVVVFSLDQVYRITDLALAQRQFSATIVDMMTDVTIWYSKDTPFTLASPGFITDLAKITLSLTDDDTFLSYPLAKEIEGRYFYMQFTPRYTNGAAYPGVAELRLQGEPVDTKKLRIIASDFAFGAIPAIADFTIERPATGSYRLEYSLDLQSWIPVANTSFTGATTDYTLSLSGGILNTNSRLFFRAVEVGPIGPPLLFP